MASKRHSGIILLEQTLAFYTGGSHLVWGCPVWPVMVVAGWHQQQWQNVVRDIVLAGDGVLMVRGWGTRDPQQSQFIMWFSGLMTLEIVFAPGVRALALHSRVSSRHLLQLLST